MHDAKYKRETSLQLAGGCAPRSHVIGPDGDVLTIDNLPPARPGRWVARKKAEVVAGVRGGLISLKDACARYELSPEEYMSWQVSLDRFGLNGLGATRKRGRVKPAEEREPASEPDAMAARDQALLGWP